MTVNVWVVVLMALIVFLQKYGVLRRSELCLYYSLTVRIKIVSRDGRPSIAGWLNMRNLVRKDRRRAAFV